MTEAPEETAADWSPGTKLSRAGTAVLVVGHRKRFLRACAGILKPPGSSMTVSHSTHKVPFLLSCLTRLDGIIKLKGGCPQALAWPQFNWIPDEVPRHPIGLYYAIPRPLAGLLDPFGPTILFLNLLPGFTILKPLTGPL